MDLQNLKDHIRTLVTLKETGDPLVSCYLNLESGRATYRNELDLRVRVIRRALPVQARRGFEEALGHIEAFLVSEVLSEANGIALFSRAGVEPFFLALQFRLPLPNHLGVDTVPNIYHLVELKDTYHRYVLLISTETHARIVEVDVGSVTQELWIARPELRKRAGREWTKQHYQSHRRDRSAKFVKEKIEMLDRLVSHREHTHLILAGTPQMVSRVRDSLPRRLKDKLIDIVRMPGAATTEAAVLATLARYAEHEQEESLNTAALLLDELARGGLAVHGTSESLAALRRAQVDVLVLASAYEAPDGWACGRCDAADVGDLPPACPLCGKRTIHETNLKEELVRVAERVGAKIEIVHESDVLFDIGGVGCLLRYRTSEQWNSELEKQRR